MSATHQPPAPHQPQTMSSEGSEAWACGRPVFYNVCISLSNLSGPIIHEHPESVAATVAAATGTTIVARHSEPQTRTTPTPVMVQPTATVCGVGGGGGRGAVMGRTVHRTVITVGGSESDKSQQERERGGYSAVVSVGWCGGAVTSTTTHTVDHSSKGGSPHPPEEEVSEPEVFLVRKVSHTSDYSLSSHSDSSVTSTSPTPTLAPHHDSDYFGSSSSSSEDERASEDDRSEDEDVQATLRAAMARLRVEEQRVGVGVRRPGAWRRRAPIKEYDLEQRIALEIKMREGTTKLLAACGAQGPRANLPHTLEAAKNLLTSNERMTAYMAELQRRRNSSLPHDRSQPSVARVCLSDLRMPLIWKDSDHFKNKGDYRRFAVFVLLKIGTEIYDTVMVNPVDRSMTDICFDDIIVFNNIPSNFECNLEIYSHVLQNDLTMASTPRKLKRTLHSSISRTVGRKLAASLRDELSNGDMGPKFELVATAKLSLDNVSNNTATFDLVMENIENQVNQLPLFGHFCCRLAAQPDCAVQERIAGYAHVAESEQQQQSWCRVYGWQLEVWGTKEDIHLSPHHPLSLVVDRSTEVTQNGASVTVANTSGFDRGRLTLTFETSSEAGAWYRCLKQHAVDHRNWGLAAEEEMEILTPQPTRHNFILPRRGRFASLYEETPLRDGSPASTKSSFDDLYGSSAFVNNYCTPAQLAPRPRALTLSSRSSFRRWGSVKCNMPFFKSKS
ncbi:rhotekin isoform X2 [Procambarus clarkii]|uniref:rhotekin isoform X2 n=1 Tax=Procambarus clarkii TaxID=6728 RepID=UPI00374365B9